MPSSKQIIIQGHRGARGLYPENTVTAFIEAIKLGVDTLEMDVVISKDLQVVVSHEPWMNPDFCTRPDRLEVENGAREKYNLFKMNYAEIAKYDCGLRGNKEFPLQKALPEHKPLFSEVITKTQAFVKENNLKKISYNIEIKSEPEKDGIFNPVPEIFVELVYHEIKRLNCLHSCNLQSFDIRILQEIKKRQIKVKTAFLVENEDSFEANIKQLGFETDIYSPDYYLVNETLVKNVHARGMLLIPWTVNELQDMKKLIALGVDGIITDYPDKAMNILIKGK
ncbi:MAG TPA: glycerophosphodiester phosphodiesterase family protein [Bacteroidia bacterium]|nr:glycerophosphodiester phosphodiesterase family protein [Bacteroidia bacterium]